MEPRNFCSSVINTEKFEQVEIKRTIPKGQGQSKDFKTKKIFVGGIPSAVPEGMVLYLTLLYVLTTRKVFDILLVLY